MSAESRRDYRFEKKFYIEEMDEHDVISLLRYHPAMFSEIYPPRYINNIYLDGPLMGNFHDNVDGLAERRKVRVRWYGELFRHVDKPVMEFKIKKGEAGFKVQHAFPPFTLDNNFTGRYFSNIIRDSDLPDEVKSRIVYQEAVLVNRYLRWYYATPDLRFRVTIDTDLSFYHLNKFHNSFMNKQVDRNHIVVELKYLPEDDRESQRISAGFPFRMTRSSKYVQGIESVYL